MRRGEQRAIDTTSPRERLTARSTQALLRRVPRDLARLYLRVKKYRAGGLVFSSRRRINTQLYVRWVCDLGALVDLGARRRLLARFFGRRQSQFDHHLRELRHTDGPVAIGIELGEQLLDLVRVDLLGRAAQQD
jgi:hypothetical protein